MWTIFVLRRRRAGRVSERASERSTDRAAEDDNDVDAADQTRVTLT